MPCRSFSGSSIPSVDNKLRTRHELGLIRNQIQHSVGYILWLAYMAYGMHGIKALAQIFDAGASLLGLLFEEVLNHRRPNKSRMHRVYSNVILCIEQRIYLGHDSVRRLGGVIGRYIWRANDAVD